MQPTFQLSDKTGGRNKHFFRNFIVFILSVFLWELGFHNTLNAQNSYYHVEITVHGCLDTLLRGAEVTLDQIPTPSRDGWLMHYVAVTDSMGVAVFDSVLGATYHLTASFPEYELFEADNLEIYADYYTTITMLPVAFPPRRFRVDSMTSRATWIPPRRETLPYQDFEDEQFPPEGWQTFGVAAGDFPWFRTNMGSAGFPVPPGDGYYAISNSDHIGSAGTSTAYLITPAIDLRAHDNYTLEFRSFYTGAYGEAATVEYSLDSGNTWTIFQTLSPDTSWVTLTYSLDSFSGQNGESNFMIGFYADDHHYWASGWAVDNVTVHAGRANPDGYFVFLNDQIIDYIDHDTNSYTFQNLSWGQTYTGGIAAVYPCNTSERVEDTWTSAFLYPPLNFYTEYTYNTDEVKVNWTPPYIVSLDTNSNLLGFTVYVDNTAVLDVPYQGEPFGDTLSVIIDSLTNGIHRFKANAYYELSNFGFPGDTGVSSFTDTTTENVVYGFGLPFFEGWNIPDFQTNTWQRTQNGAEWIIDVNEGNPKSSAALSLIPDSGEYSAILTSYPINASNYSNVKIYLDFDLDLEIHTATSYDFLEVQVFNGTRWVTTSTYNSSNAYSFAYQHFDITDDALNRVFKIRFSAHGPNSSTGNIWRIDNIHVYYVCFPPQNLTGEYVWIDSLNQNLFGALITWEAPDTSSKGARLNTSFENGNAFTAGHRSNRTLNGYNIYRKADDEDDYTLYANIPAIDTITTYLFYDFYPNVSLSKGYFYKVTALWEYEESCESEPAHALQIPTDDFVYIFITGLQNNAAANTLRIYPNPASHRINVESNYPVSRVSLLSLQGKTILRKDMNGANKTALNVESIPPGLYLLKIRSDKKTEIRKIVIK